MQNDTSPRPSEQVGGRDPVSRLIGMDVEEYLAADENAARAQRALRDDDVAQQGLKAMMLAPNLIVCRALLRGERVPWNVLLAGALHRYGLKQRPADGRIGLDDVNDVPWPR